METKFDYTKYAESGTAVFKKIGISLNENNNNIKWADLTPEQKVLAEKIKDDPDYCPTYLDMFMLNEMAVLTTYVWEQNKKLQVFFLGGTADFINETLEIANIWNKHCNISFVRTMIQDKSDLRVSFINDGCWSYIGNNALLVNKGEATINFEITNLAPKDAEFKRVVLHEFGHVLGLIHEHQSPSVIMIWNKQLIYAYFWSKYRWTIDKVNINLFEEYDNLPKAYSRLDKESIMAYYLPKEFTLNHVEFPLNYELSKIDIDCISDLYPKLITS